MASCLTEIHKPWCTNWLGNAIGWSALAEQTFSRDLSMGQIHVRCQMIIWNSSFFPALYSSCSELNHKKIQYCSSSGLSRLCSSFLDLSNFLISGKSSNEKKPETRNSWNEEFPETRKILKRGISWNEEILSHHRLLCFITNIKRNTAGLSSRREMNM